MAQILFIIGAIVMTLPGVFLRVTGTHLDPLTASLLYGLAVVGAAFLLSWAAEVAQHDIPRSLALTILALIAVLPEYAVDMYLTWRAAGDPQTYAPLAPRLPGHGPPPRLVAHTCQAEGNAEHPRLSCPYRHTVMTDGRWEGSRAHRGAFSP